MEIKKENLLKNLKSNIELKKIEMLKVLGGNQAGEGTDQTDRHGIA